MSTDGRKDEKTSERQESSIREYGQGEWIADTSFQQGDLSFIAYENFTEKIKFHTP